MSEYVVPQPRISVPAEAPDAYRALIAFSRTVDEQVDPILGGLIKLRASQLNGCSLCVDMHTRESLKGGEDERRLFAVTAWHESPFFTARERAALELTESITLVSETHVPDEVWERAEKEFSPAEMAHLVLAIAAINSLNRLAISSRTVPRP